jgi:hypothetical protein
MVNKAWANHVKLTIHKVDPIKLKLFDAGSTTSVCAVTPAVEVAITGAATRVNMMVGMPCFNRCDIILGRDVLGDLGLVFRHLPTSFPAKGSDRTMWKEKLSLQDRLLDDKFWEEHFRLQGTPLSPTQQAVSTRIREGITANLTLNEALPADSKCQIPDSVVHLSTGDAKPVNIAPFKIAKAFEDEIDKIVDKWDGWVIEPAPAGNQWNFPLIVVPKKGPDGNWTKKRTCIDVRRLNALLPSDSYPLPEIKDILEDLGGKQIFSILDLSDGFHHFEISAKDRPKCSFTWRRRQWMFKRAPFGIKHLPALFQRILESVIQGLTFCRVYIDDIVVFSDSEEEHADHLKIIIDRLTKAGLHLGIAKCHFGVPAVRVLGHFVDGNGIRPDKDKAMEMINFPQPRSSKDLQSFMGLANYFSSYIPKYSQLCAPLNALRSPEVALKFDWAADWKDDILAAFTGLKEVLATCFTLSYPDWNKRFYLATDASTIGVGGVLYQKEDDGTIKYVQVMSRSLSKAERNYSATKLELTAIVYCLKRCGYYLFGRKFTLETDHKALTYMLTQKELSPLLTRWYEHIMVHDFDVVHIQGIKHVLPDALSRLYPDFTRNLITDEEDEPITFMFAEMFPQWRGDYSVGDNFKLFPEYFHLLGMRYGVHTIDLFAHPGNAQTKRFCGLARPRKKKHSKFKYEGKPFDLDWSKENGYAFPPVGLIDDVLNKVVADRCSLTLVTPVNTSAPWFERCMKMSLVAPIVLDYTQSCMLGYGTDYRDVVTAPWGNYALWRVSAAPPPKRDVNSLVQAADEMERLEASALEAFYKAGQSFNGTATMAAATCSNPTPENVSDAGPDKPDPEVVISLDDQKNITLLKHLEGHVGSSAMVAKLKDEGHSWPHMQELCQEVIRGCFPCQVNKLENPKYHELKATTASLPMDHIAIDCHTMHIPSEGYGVLLLVIDCCTRFIWIRALEDKSALTVAYALWNIFANFGFPKVMQSDNGTEFLNGVVSALAKASHIDHRLITPYHPRANGMVERMFRPIMEMIRSFCNGATPDWFHSIPQVQLWLNLRTSKAHGYTPFSLMFSRPFVGFKDFSKVPLSELSPEQLAKRYDTVFNFCYPAIDKVAQKVVSQCKLKFDGKCNICLEPFPDGSYVMLRDPRWKSKQHPQYIGPFLVLRRTRGGSYVLQDETGDLFPRNATPSQLKLVSYENVRNALDAGESVHEVEHILNHDGAPLSRQYKIRWAGYGPREDTWEDASHIQTSLITKYWEDIGKTQKKAIVNHMAKKGNQSPGSDDDTEPEDGAKPNVTPKKKRSVVSTAASHKPKRLRTQK